MDKSTAAQNIRRLAVQYQGMVEAADALEQIGSLEQHEAEVRARLAGLLKTEAEAQHRLEVIDQAARDADAEQEATRKQTRLDAEAALTFSTEQAKEIIGNARARAKALIEGADAVNDEQSKVLEQLKSETESTLARIAQEEADALARKASADAAADAAQAKLDAIRKQIADIANA